CTEVRNLQRTEIGEVAEAFDAESQVGSFTMAHKENPVASENVCSLARIVRSLVIPALEDVPLWHERDLTNSAAERILLPHACVLIDEMLARTTEVFRPGASASPESSTGDPYRSSQEDSQSAGQVFTGPLSADASGTGLPRGTIQSRRAWFLRSDGRSSRALEPTCRCPSLPRSGGNPRATRGAAVRPG